MDVLRGGKRYCSSQGEEIMRKHFRESASFKLSSKLNL